MNSLKIIAYTKGYKYQLSGGYWVSTSLRPSDNGKTSAGNAFTAISDNGLLCVRAGYAWDGPSGPAIDTANFMRASLVHDALYQLMRDGKIDKKYRKQADVLMYKICREDGMSWVRAKLAYWAVRKFAGFAAKSSSKRKTIYAP